LHFDLDCEWTRATIASLPGLPPAAIAMLLSDDERQHIEVFGQVVCGVVADYERADRLDVRRIVRWQFAMAPHLFVSARRRASHTLHQVHLDLQAGRPYERECRRPAVARLANGIHRHLRPDDRIGRGDADRAAADPAALIQLATLVLKSE
jgi:hypothetical protein